MTAELLQWIAERGIAIAPCIEVVDDHGYVKVQATSSIAEGSVLCIIPKAAVLSKRTSGVADLLEGGAEELRLEGGLALLAVILHELSLGAKSSWHGYLDSLPRRGERLPVFWTADERAQLAGSEAARRLEAHDDSAAMQEDFEEHLLPWARQFPNRLRLTDFTLDRFRVAASWVASRAFGVDRWHGMSLVPLADAFNHKAAVVRLTADYAVEGASSDSDDQDADGGSRAASPDVDNGEDGSDAEGSADENGSQAGSECSEGIRFLRPPVVSAGAHAAFDAALQLDIGICSVERDGDDVLEVVAAQPLAAGTEVFNSYGELSNAELLIKYGFALRGNPFSTVELDKAALLAAAAEALGDSEMVARQHFIEEHSNLLEDSCEPFELLPGARLGPALIAVLWMLFAPRRIFSRWRSAEDAVNSMQDAQAQAIDRTPQAAQTLAGTHCADLQQDVLAAVHPGSEAVQACTWLPRTAPTALLQAVECRAACYSAGPAAPRLRAPVGDRTLCAALTLIADEQEILEGCLKSIRNYISSPRKRHRPSDMY